jgi:CheY-like chemotaxis protein
VVLQAQRTLLLADDSLAIQKVVSLIFGDEGVQVVTAGGGAEALAQLERAVPDVVLADVHMPAPNGYELCARIKQDARTRHVPVMLLVGKYELFDEAEARACGADEVLTKPFQSIRELVSKVGGLIGGGHEQNKQAQAAREDVSPAHDEAHDAAIAALESPSHAEAEDLQPSPIFAGLDTDDESIESVPADDYLAAGRARTEDAAAEFVTNAGPFASTAAGVVGEVRNVEAAAGVAEASSFGAAAGSSAPGGYAAARFGSPQPESGFAARPPQPPSDDSLLELGDAVSARSRDAADFDDLILDIGDDTDATDAEATDSADVFEAVHVEEQTDDESPAEISPANLSNAWSDAPSIEVPPARATFVEPVIDEADAPASVEPESEVEAEAAAVAESDAVPAALETVETQDAPHAAASAATLTEVAHPEVAEPRVEVAESRTEVSESRTHAADATAGAAQFSPELVDAVARRVVELMSDRAVREIAWEVVPDLAERLIRERLAQENTRAS